MNENVKRKTRLKGNERRDQILRTATEVFSKHGFHGSSMRQLARAAGVRGCKPESQKIPSSSDR